MVLSPPPVPPGPRPRAALAPLVTQVAPALGITEAEAILALEVRRQPALIRSLPPRAPDLFLALLGSLLLGSLLAGSGRRPCWPLSSLPLLYALRACLPPVVAPFCRPP